MKNDITQPLPQNTRLFTVSKALAQEAGLLSLLQSGAFKHHVAHSIVMGDSDNWDEFKYVCFDEVLIPEYDEIAVFIGEDADGDSRWIYEGRRYFIGDGLQEAMYNKANGI